MVNHSFKGWTEEERMNWKGMNKGYLTLKKDELFILRINHSNFYISPFWNVIPSLFSLLNFTIFISSTFLRVFYPKKEWFIILKRWFTFKCEFIHSFKGWVRSQKFTLVKRWIEEWKSWMLVKKFNCYSNFMSKVNPYRLIVFN